MTVGTEEYALATDYEKFREMVITTAGFEKPIKLYNYREFRDNFPNTANDPQGCPQLAYYSPNVTNSIRFYQIPDTSYTVSYDYYKAPTDMTLTTDTPFFNSKFHHILADFALAMFYESAAEAQYDKANFHRAKFEGEIKELISDTRGRSDIMYASYQGQESE